METNDIVHRAENMSAKLTAIYRQLHQIPEPSYKEHKTAAAIVNILKEEGFCNIVSGVGGTGITVSVGEGPPLVALRADMDALPIEEETNLPYKSTHPGLMHACGHDAHMTMLLGAGLLLKETALQGKAVKLLFQPAEETPPGGAKAMIEQGVLNKELKAIFGLHCQPHLPAGIVALKEGATMAAADMFSISVSGKGGHGAMPHQTEDAVLIGSMIVQELQTIVSRRIDPLEPAVVTVGSFHAGSKSNIIPGKAVLEGTVRTLNPQLRKEIPVMMENIIKGICSGYNVKYSFDYQWGYPPVINDAKLVKLVEQAAKKTVGPQKTYYTDRPSMGGEDFAYYLEHVPGAFFYLGVGMEDIQQRFPWHHPKFQIEPSCLPVGAAVLAQVVLDTLGGSYE